MTVTAPPEVQARLLDLQALDDELGRIRAHRTRLQAGAELAAVQQEVVALRRERADVLGRAEDLRTRLGRLESDAAVVAQRLERDRSRLGTSSSVRDVAGLEQEIAVLLRRRDTLDDDELALMEQLETVDAEAADVEGRLAQTGARAAAQQGDRDDALSGLASREKDVTVDRTALADDLPADLVALYDRQRLRYGVGAALLTRGVSGGSNMALTAADLAAARAAPADAIVLDGESGCILVRTAESGL